MSTATIDSRSPQAPSEVVVSVAASDAGQVRQAVQAARAAGREWAATPAHQRAIALSNAADGLAARADHVVDLMVREVGKPLPEAQMEHARGVAILRYAAQQALDPDGETYPAADGQTLLMARRYPRGVAGLITPWNFPIAIPLWKAAPALAHGNAVVLKPAQQAAGCGQALGEILGGALPDGVLQVVHGSGSHAGQAVLDTVDVLSFTGSVEVGHALAVAATERGIPVQAEMGGQNASLILPDADHAAAAAKVASAAMGYAGQKCTATSRVIVVGDPEPFTEALVEAVRGLGVGDPADESTVVGPVIDERSRDQVLQAASRAESQDGKVLVGGSALERDGWFVGPTVVGNLKPDAALAQEEVFGPIAAVLTASDVDAAVDIANGVRYGLVTAVFTRDLDRVLDLAARLDTGMLKVNAPTSGVDFHAPFGGEKASSVGPREQGKAARDFYTLTRTISVSPAG